MAKKTYLSPGIMLLEIGGGDPGAGGDYRAQNETYKTSCG